MYTILEIFIDQLHDDEWHLGFSARRAINHTAHQNLDYLHQLSNNLLVSTGMWLPRSPDYMAPDLFLSTHLKNRKTLFLRHISIP